MKNHPLSWVRRGAFGAAVTLLVSATALGQSDAKKKCATSYANAQRLKNAGQLKAAREESKVCAQSACLDAVRKECLGWLDDLGKDIPTLVITARDDGGKDVMGAKVTIDGQAADEGLGKPIALDPGNHTVRIEATGFAPAESKLVLAVGERNRAFAAKLVATNATAAVAPGPTATPTATTPPSDEKTPSKAGVSPLVYLFGGVAVAGGAAATVFYLSGHSARGKLDDEACKPRCAQADVDKIKRDYRIGDIGLAVSVVSLGAAAYVLLKPSSASASSSASLDVAPTAGGAQALWRGVF